ncbi:hypothetical protein [Streptomyces sp. NPDC006739]|uniref:hypothetical protein n=1 Tax=Streptomyces sp. NPDC006739 TaxID=3364763 RepID=UPI0036A359D3
MTAPHPRTARSGPGFRILRAAVFAAVCVVLAASGHALASCATVPLWTLGAGFVGSLVLMAPLTGRARSLPGIVTLLALGQLALHTLFELGQRGMPGMAGMASGSGATTAGATGSMGSVGSMGSMGSAGVAHVTGLSDASLVERAAQLVCGSGAAAISPSHAYRILVAAHVLNSSATDPAAVRHVAAATGAAGVTGSSPSPLPSLSMLLGHLLAALAVGWLLRRGDLALLRLIELSAHGVAEGALVRSLRGAFALACALCAGLLPAAAQGSCGRRTARDEPPAPHTTALQHTVIRRGPPAAAFSLAA